MTRNSLQVNAAIATIRDACDRYDHRGTPQHDPDREPLPERIVIDEIDRMARAITLVRANHQPNPFPVRSGGPTYRCSGCSRNWPCPTIRILNVSLGEDA